MLQLIKPAEIRSSAGGSGIEGRRGVLYQTVDETPSRMFWWDGEKHVLLPGMDSGGNLLDGQGGVLALSEPPEEVLADPSATTQILTGPGEYSHYRCTTATGNITVYDNTASSGKLLVPTTALVLGTHPIFGSSDTRSLIVSLGIRVVLSGAGVAYIGRRVY
jgi:hypothetical protein